MNKKEILNELISIKEYMEERNAFHGYGQMNDLIAKLESEEEQISREEKSAKHKNLIADMKSMPHVKWIEDHNRNL